MTVFSSKSHWTDWTNRSKLDKPVKTRHYWTLTRQTLDTDWTALDNQQLLEDIQGDMLKAALYYRDKGFSVIPISKTKNALVKWKTYQKTIASEQEITQWWTQWPSAMIGIITGKVSGHLAVIDVDAPEQASPVFEQHIPDTMLIPTALSPTPGRYHLYFRYPEDVFLRNTAKKVVFGTDLRAEGGYIIAPPSIRGDGKYRWQDELSIENVAIPQLPPSLLSIYKEYFLSYKSSSSATALNFQDGASCGAAAMFQKGRRDDDLFHVANHLVKSGMPQSEIYQVMSLLAAGCNPPFSANEIHDKIQSAVNRGERRDKNLAAEVYEWVGFSCGQFLSSEVYQALGVSTRNDKKTVSYALTELVTKQHIERWGGKNGCFRRIDRSLAPIDILNADTTPVYVKLPLAPEDFVTLHKGNVIILAGETNAGKTAYCLNAALMNKNRFRVNYLSSEMQNGTELRVRIDEFNQPLDIWSPILFSYRTDGFPDVIDPTGLNIVDYLNEGTEQEAYRMSSRISAIAAKLTTGIVLIAIQKSSQKTFGLGGESTMNTARLYMTISRNNIVKIEKGKIWANKFVNPNGMQVKFRLSAGCRFSKAEGEEWRR